MKGKRGGDKLGKREKHRPQPRPDASVDADAVALSTLAVGESGEIVRVISKSRSRMARLGAYGVVPGSQVHLLQKIPAFVIRLGETELGLDHEVARDILVRRKVRGTARDR